MSDLALQFIYNAHSGKVNALFDIAHKLISPGTYSCDLCQITHETFSENAEFSALKAQHPIELFHIDEYEAHYPAEEHYPVIIVRKHGDIIQRIDRQRIGQLRSVGDLKSLLADIEAAQA
ncbi:hypothetical protein MNBD_GAMMA13-719 [hydrothermal vent metagenome]|uniref:GTPase n=1 Tax=hydrothermal vent metagenome TaxID=652676 RepID=A0A3B0Y7H8_9ZZZZ